MVATLHRDPAMPMRKVMFAVTCKHWFWLLGSIAAIHSSINSTTRCIHILDPLHYAKWHFDSRTTPKIEDYTSSLWKIQFYVHRLLPATRCTALSQSSQYTPNITTKAHIILLCGRQVVLVNQQFQHLLVSFHCSVMHCRSSTLKQ